MLITFAEFQDLDTLAVEIDELKDTVLEAQITVSELKDELKEYKESEDYSPRNKKTIQLKSDIKDAEKTLKNAETDLKKKYVEMKRVALATLNGKKSGSDKLPTTDSKLKKVTLDKATDEQVDKAINWKQASVRAESEAEKEIEKIKKEALSDYDEDKEIQSNKKFKKESKEKENSKNAILKEITKAYKNKKQLETEISELDEDDIKGKRALSDKIDSIEETIDELTAEFKEKGGKQSEIQANVSKIDEKFGKISEDTSKLKDIAKNKKDKKLLNDLDDLIADKVSNEESLKELDHSSTAWLKTKQTINNITKQIRQLKKDYEGDIDLEKYISDKEQEIAADNSIINEYNSNKKESKSESDKKVLLEKIKKIAKEYFPLKAEYQNARNDGDINKVRSLKEDYREYKDKYEDLEEQYLELGGKQSELNKVISKIQENVDEDMEDESMYGSTEKANRDSRKLKKEFNSLKTIFAVKIPNKGYLTFDKEFGSWKDAALFTNENQAKQFGGKNAKIIDVTSKKSVLDPTNLISEDDSDYDPFDDKYTPVSKTKNEYNDNDWEDTESDWEDVDWDTED